MKTYFRKIYTRVGEMEDARASIIAYKKVPIYFDMVNRGPHPEGQFLNKPVGWRHMLYIDLWIVYFYFHWFSGEKRKHAFNTRI